MRCKIVYMKKKGKEKDKGKINESRINTFILTLENIENIVSFHMFGLATSGINII